MSQDLPVLLSQVEQQDPALRTIVQSMKSCDVHRRLYSLGFAGVTRLKTATTQGVQDEDESEDDENEGSEWDESEDEGWEDTSTMASPTNLQAGEHYQPLWQDFRPFKLDPCSRACEARCEASSCPSLEKGGVCGSKSPRVGVKRSTSILQPSRYRQKAHDRYDRDSQNECAVERWQASQRRFYERHPDTASEAGKKAPERDPEGYRRKGIRDRSKDK
ncbi:unnamed protein product [Sympodiomycopsis kandeliae]